MAFNHKKIIQNGGIMLYYVIEKLKSIKFSQSAEWLLTLLYLVVAVVLVVYTINPTWITGVYTNATHFLVCNY